MSRDVEALRDLGDLSADLLAESSDGSIPEALRGRAARHRAVLTAAIAALSAPSGDSRAERIRALEEGHRQIAGFVNRNSERAFKAHMQAMAAQRQVVYDPTPGAGDIAATAVTQAQARHHEAARVKYAVLAVTDKLLHPHKSATPSMRGPASATRARWTVGSNVGFGWIQTSALAPPGPLADVLNRGGAVLQTVLGWFCWGCRGVAPESVGVMVFCGDHARCGGGR